MIPLDLHLYNYFIFIALVGVRATLTWHRRMEIALDAARGLAFLHDVERPIIYRDFKTSNILLDSVSFHSCYVPCNGSLLSLHESLVH